ncbi:uncharacterized protein LOC135696988 [Ochlerotatus camptorhynchus]|uniref:uncharacterized protein LOC135696988 n=1 Tax=Ochlerotatus camptorhynchus TaxID=644619 RepID=UPI0031DEC34C
MEFKAMIFVSLVVVLTFIDRADALKCYRCNSFDNPDCLGEPDPSGVKNLTKLEQFLRECYPDETGREPFCRKISVTILNNKHHRVIRECGYERSKTDCYVADNEDHLETVCQCWKDQCNRAERLELGAGLMTAVAVAMLRMLI